MIPITEQNFSSLGSFLQTIERKHFNTSQEKLSVIAFFKDQFQEWQSEPKDHEKFLYILQSIPQKNAIYFKTLAVALRYFPIDLDPLSLDQREAYFKKCAEIIEVLGFTASLEPLIETHLPQIAPYFKRIHLNFDKEGSLQKFDNEFFIEQLLTYSNALEELWISHSSLTLYSLRHLYKPTGLKSLHIDHCQNFNSRLPKGLNHLKSLIFHQCPNYNQRFPRLPELRTFILNDCPSYLHSLPKPTVKIQKVMISAFPWLDDIKYRLKFIKQIHRQNKGKAKWIAQSFGLSETSEAYIKSKRKSYKRITENQLLLKKICAQFRPEFFDPILTSPSLLTEPNFIKLTASALSKHSINISDCNMESETLKQVSEQLEELDLRPTPSSPSDEIAPYILDLLDQHTPRLARLHISRGQLSRALIDIIVKKQNIELVFHYSSIGLFGHHSLCIKHNSLSWPYLLENLLMLGNSRASHAFFDHLSDNIQLTWWLELSGLFKQDQPFNRATIGWILDFNKTPIKKFIECPNSIVVEQKVKQTYKNEGIAPFLKSSKLLKTYFKVFRLPLTNYLCLKNEEHKNFCNNLISLSKSRLLDYFCATFPQDHTTTQWLLLPNLFTLNDPKNNHDIIRWLLKFDEENLESFLSCPHQAIIKIKIRKIYLQSGIIPFIDSKALLKFCFIILNFPLSGYLALQEEAFLNFKMNLLWLSKHRLLELFCEKFPDDGNHSHWLLIPNLFVESRQESMIHFDFIVHWPQKKLQDLLAIHNPHLLLKAINHHRNRFGFTPEFNTLVEHFFHVNPQAKEGYLTLSIKKTHQARISILPELLNESPDLVLMELDARLPLYVEFAGNSSIDHGGPGRTFVRELIQGLLQNSTHLRFEPNEENLLFPSLICRPMTTYLTSQRHFHQLGVLFGLCIKQGYPTGEIFSRKWLYCLQSVHHFLAKDNTFKNWIHYLECAADTRIDENIKTVLLSKTPAVIFQAAKEINTIWEEELIAEYSAKEDIESLRTFIFEEWVKDFLPYLYCSKTVAEGIQQSLPYWIEEIYIESIDQLEFATNDEFADCLQGRLNADWLKMNIEAPQECLEMIHDWIDDHKENLVALSHFVQAFTGAKSLLQPITFEYSSDLDGCFIHTCTQIVEVPINITRKMFGKFLNECGSGTVVQFYQP